MYIDHQFLFIAQFNQIDIMWLKRYIIWKNSKANTPLTKVLNFHNY